MVCDALREMLRAARLLNTPVHISHLKAMGPRNWNRRIPEALALLQQARDEGLDVSCDVYPYCAGSTQLLHLLPQDFLAGGTDAVAARLRDPAQRDILRERIAHGRDFDNIAQMVGWDNIRLTTLHRPEFLPLTARRLRGGPASRAGAGRLPVPCAGRGGLQRDDDRLHHLRRGHRANSARAVCKRHLRFALSHGGPAPPARLRDIHAHSRDVRPRAPCPDAAGACSA